MKSTDFVVNERPRLAAVKRFPAVEFADYERRLANDPGNLAACAAGVPRHVPSRHHRSGRLGYRGQGRRGAPAGLGARSAQFQGARHRCPNGREKSLHYLQRFWERLPEHGQIVVFDRSWYGRVLVERVEGYATPAEWRRAYDEINDFERMLLEDGTRLVKIFLHITPEEQSHRFRARLTDPLKRWKLSYEDFRNRGRWKEYEAAIEDMMEKTSVKRARWHLVPANNKPFGRLAAFRIIADQLSQGVDLEPRPLDPMVAEAAEQLLGIRLPSVNHHGH